MDFAEQLRQRLVESGYSPQEAEGVMEKLLHLQGDLRQALEQWVTRGEVATSLEVGEYTLAQLMADFGMAFPAALLTLDWVRREPEKAQAALRHGLDVLR